ncbi:MAG: hypothetical protein NC078_12090 [Ruminococcus sp.]|nr:hypothetical protein [Ruminococcus sp.]
MIYYGKADDESMKFYTVDEMKTIPEEILGGLTAINDAIITDKGKPAAIMLKITNDNYDDLILSIKQARAMSAIKLMQQQSEMNGIMTPEEIDAEIAAARRGE